MKRVCVFCGASPGVNGIYAESARKLGHALADTGIELVYGAGSVGLMGTIATAALEKGGCVIGVIPQSLVKKELPPPALDSLIVVDTLMERKVKMAELSDAFIILPGGFGTLDEFSEMLTWTQIKAHNKPCILLNVNGFYDSLLTFFDHLVAEGFVNQINRQNFIKVESDPVALVQGLAGYKVS